MHSQPWYWPSQEAQGPLTTRTSSTWGQCQFFPHLGPLPWHILPSGCLYFLNVYGFVSLFYLLSRNRDKKEAFTSTHMACLLLKTTFDCISRITLFGVYMYVQNEGQFSTRMTVTAYYSVFVLLMIFNTWINKNKNFWSAKNLLGIFITNTKQCNPFIISQYIFYRDCSLLQQLQLRCCPQNKGDLLQLLCNSWNVKFFFAIFLTGTS